jgi:nucleoside-diphosphate-sugar epimerase
MSTPYRDLLAALPAQPKTRLVTGVAGFIGSNLLETPRALDQTVVGLDRFATGHRRCFNVFGPRQDPAGADAAVSPTWTASLHAGAEVFINRDGETSRDVCDIDNTVQAHLPAATLGNPAAVNPVYTVAVGEGTTLNARLQAIRETRAPRFPHPRDVQPHDRDFRPGDVRHSPADIDKARRRLGYAPGGSQTDGDVVHVRSDVADQDPSFTRCCFFSRRLVLVTSA